MRPSTPVNLYMLLLLFAIAGVAQSAIAQESEEPGTDLFYSANALYNRRLFPIAIKEYNSFLKKHPGHSKVAQARYGLALSYYSAGMYKEGEPLLKELAEKGDIGNKLQLSLLRAHCLLKIANPAEAEKVFTHVLSATTDKTVKVSAMLGLAEAAFAQKNWEPTVSWAQKIVAADPGEANVKRALYQAGWARHQMKAFAEAIPQLEQLAAMVTGESLAPRAAYLLAECYRETGNLPGAAEHYQKAVKAMSGDIAAEVWYRLGYVHFLQKKYADAVSAFQTCVGTKPDGKFVETAKLYLGRSRLEDRSHDAARRTFEELARGTSQYAAAGTLWLARVYARQKRYNDALRILDPSLTRFQKDPMLPDLLYDHASALIAQNKFEDAAKSLAKVVEKDDWPHRKDVLRMYAICLHRMKDYTGSLKYADEFIGSFPKDDLVPEVLFVKGENLYLLARLDEAGTTFGKLAADFPESSNADAVRFRVAQVLHRESKWQEALSRLGPIIEKAPEEEIFSQLFFVAGDCYFRLEKWDDAASHMDRFIRDRAAARHRHRNREVREPNIDTALLELAVSNLNKGDQQGTLHCYRTLLSQYPNSPHLPMALSELGRLQYESKDYKSARKTLGRFVREYGGSPQRPQVEYYLGWTSQEEGKEDEAAQHFAMVTRSFPKHPLGAESALQWGLVLLSQDKNKEAQGVFLNWRKSYETHPKLPVATFSLGIAYARANDWRRAIPYFKSVLEGFPKSDVADRAAYEWAWCEKGLKHNAEAVKRYQFLLANYPDSDLSLKAQTELAELTFDAEKFDEVIAQLKKTLEGLENKELRERTLYRLATAYFNKKDYEQSVATFESFLQEFRNSSLAASAHFQAGESKMKLKETSAAREHFSSAIKTENATLRETALLRLGETQALTKQFPQSESSYREMLKSYPDGKWARRAVFGLGWALEKQGSYEEAMSEYRKVLAAGSNRGRNEKDRLAARAQFQIGESLFAMKKYDAAIQELVRVDVNYRYKDWSSKALLEMGRALDAKGDKDKAVAQFREVIRKFPQHEAAVVAKQRLDVLRRSQ